LSIMNCLRETWPSLLKAINNNFAVWREQSGKNARVFSMTTPDHTHCKHDESDHSGNRLGDSSTYDLLSGPCPIWLPPLPLSLQQSALREVPFNNDAELQNWFDEFFTAKPADFFKRGIENLAERWEAVVNNGREYIIDWSFEYLCEKINYFKNRTNLCTNPIHDGYLEPTAQQWTWLFVCKKYPQKLV
jgi:hypothetical protein